MLDLTLHSGSCLQQARYLMHMDTILKSIVLLVFVNSNAMPRENESAIINTIQYSQFVIHTARIQETFGKFRLKLTMETSISRYSLKIPFRTTVTSPYDT